MFHPAGCGEMPDGLEQAVKLMVPGELASVACRASHAYGTRLVGASDVPPPLPLSAAAAGVTPEDAVVFEVELFGFDREGHWQVCEWWWQVGNEGRWQVREWWSYLP